VFLVALLDPATAALLGDTGVASFFAAEVTGRKFSFASVGVENVLGFFSVFADIPFRPSWDFEGGWARDMLAGGVESASEIFEYASEGGTMGVCFGMRGRWGMEASGVGAPSRTRQNRSLATKRERGARRRVAVAEPCPRGVWRGESNFSERVRHVMHELVVPCGDRAIFMHQICLTRSRVGCYEEEVANPEQKEKLTV
jgi:hypothetical protein